PMSGSAGSSVVGTVGRSVRVATVTVAVAMVAAVVAVVAPAGSVVVTGLALPVGRHARDGRAVVGAGLGVAGEVRDLRAVAVGPVVVTRLHLVAGLLLLARLLVVGLCGVAV